MSDVAQATTEVVPRPTASRPNLVSVGTSIWLSSELMFFAALFAMYFTIRSVDKGLNQPWPQAHLDLTLASINTTVLLLFSLSLETLLTLLLFRERRWRLEAVAVTSEAPVILLRRTVPHLRARRPTQLPVASSRWRTAASGATSQARSKRAASRTLS